MGYARFKVKDFFPKLINTFKFLYHIIIKKKKKIIKYSRKHQVYINLEKNFLKNYIFIGPSFNMPNLFNKWANSKIDIFLEDGFSGFKNQNIKTKINYTEFYNKKEDTSIKKTVGWSDFSKNKKNIEVLYPSVKIPKIKNKKNNKKEINIFFSGSASYRKGVDILYEAFKRIKEKLGKEYKLNLIMASVPFRIEAGNYAQNKRTIEDIYKECKKRKDTYFGPIYPNSLVHNFLRKTDIFVLPTRNDSFGFAVLEAMSYSIPIITTNINAMPEIVQHNKNGFLLDIKEYSLHERALNKKGFFEDSVRQLEKYLTKLIKNPELRKKMGNESRNIVKKKFNIEKTKIKLKKIFEEVLKKN